MNYILVVFASFTTANRVKSLLKNNHNINSAIVQTPGGINVKSCSYSLRLLSAHADLVWNIVRQNKLSSKGIFSEADFIRVR